MAARAVVAPFASAPSSVLDDFEVGAAFTTSRLPEGFPALRGRTALDAAFFSPQLWVRGRRQRVGLQLRWRPGPFSIEAEHIRVTDERRGEGIDGTDLSPFLSTGWYVGVTWAVTGERKAAGLDAPRRPLFRGGAGAVELALRVERLAFGSVAHHDVLPPSPRATAVLGNSDRAETFGASWYLNRWVKLQANLIRETIADPSRGPLPERPTFWSQVARIQLSI